MSEVFQLNRDVILWQDDCRRALRILPDNFVDSIVTDPPYHLLSTVKRFANSPRTDSTMPKAEAYARHSAGFMGQIWDGGDISFKPEIWAEMLRVLKPGGHLVAFGGSRTSHRIFCAIEDAGFEIRDSLMWIYGTGFPKSHDVSKGIDREAGAARETVGTEKVRDIRNGHGRALGEGIHASGRDGPVYMERELTAPATPEAAQWEGWGTALKPAFEPIILARKSLSEDTVAANVLKWGTGAINIGACRVESEGGVPRQGEASQDRRYTNSGSTNFAALPGPRGGAPEGRWPANILTDGSAEVIEAFPQTRSGNLNPLHKHGRAGISQHEGWDQSAHKSYTIDSGSAARFFYSAKASKEDRAGSKHPTVKPIALLQWLVRLVTPLGGVVLDPFAGSGTTGAAALREGLRCLMIEREMEYAADIRRRFNK